MDFLGHLAGEQYALEFAIGTGRISLPLIRAGVRVDGIEQSQAMIDRTREKPGGVNVNVIVAGDAGHRAVVGVGTLNGPMPRHSRVTRSASHA